MKKNWIYIALCLGFIVAWQVFVVAPYNKKNTPAHPPVASTQTKSDPTSTEVLVAEEKKINPNQTAKLNLDTTSQAKTSRELKPEQRSQAKKIELSLKRSVKVFPNGLIGEALFEDYKVRGKDANAVETMKQGLLWSSSNPAVDACLAGLQLNQEDTQRIQFSNRLGNATCSLVYNRDPQKEGVVGTELTLQGFEISQGQFVELKGGDAIGTSKMVEDHNALFVKVDGSLQKIKEKKISEAGTLTGKMDWISWGDKYFATVLIPRGMFNPNVVHGSTGKDNEAFFAAQYPLVLDDAKAMRVNLDLYFGVKDPTVLSNIHPTLYEAVDLGWMGSVARALLWALKSIYLSLSWLHLGNYGFAIIVLTLLVRAVFWPLNKKVFFSSQKMKELQPHIEKIKAKYSTKDRASMEQLNRETMALYRTHKVNPLGSCLPLLLQMPIFIGLYGALSHSLDLYQAPFFGWIHDLSSPDPYYVFPILWTLTLLAYVKLNPAQQQAGMPDMKWIMIGMNVFFGFLSKDWPAGLTLYLFVSNFVGITQQYLFQRAGKKLQPIQEGA